MTIDLKQRWDKVAVYLPAMQYHYARAVDNIKLLKGRDFPKDLKLTDGV